MRRSGLKNVCLGERRRLALPRAALEEHRCLGFHILNLSGTLSSIVLKLYLASPRATELLPGLVEKDMNWIDVEVVGVNDMTFTRYETISKMSSSSDEKPSVK